MADSDAVPLTSSDVTRYKRRYEFGKHLLHVRNFFLVLTCLPLAFITYVIVATLITSRNFGLVIQNLINAMVFLVCAGFLWLVSLGLKLCAYRLFNSLDSAVNSEPGLTTEDKAQLKELAE